MRAKASSVSDELKDLHCLNSAMNVPQISIASDQRHEPSPLLIRWCSAANVDVNTYLRDFCNPIDHTLHSYIPDRYNI